MNDKKRAQSKEEERLTVQDIMRHSRLPRGWSEDEWRVHLISLGYPERHSSKSNREDHL